MFKFENMDVWVRAVQLSTEVYLLSKNISDFGFKDQIGRSALSVPSNIAEGMERNSVKESLNFLSYAKASCGELFTQLIIGQKVGYIEPDKASELTSESKALSKMIGALINKRKEFID